MVWPPDLAGQFLEHAHHDRRYPLLLLIARRGLRRGEAVGLRLIDLHLDARSIDVANQIVQHGWETDMSAPKTDSSENTVASTRTPP